MFPPASVSHSVLIIDDDPVLTALVAAWLMTLGHRSAPASTAAEALRVVRSGHRFDVLLTDLHVGRDDGSALIHELIPSLPADALFILMSSHLPPRSETSIFHRTLEKPFSKDDLIRALNDTAGNRSTTDATAPPEIDPIIFSQLQSAFSPVGLRELYALTFDEARERVAKIAAAYSSSEFDRVREHAHALRGSCGMAGLARLARHAAALEQNPSGAFDNNTFMTCIKSDEHNLSLRLGLSAQDTCNT